MLTIARKTHNNSTPKATTKVVVQTQPSRKSRRRRKPRKQNNGDSTTKAPIAVSMRTTTRQPRLKQRLNYVEITHREYVQDVSSSNAGFAVRDFGVNPGVSATFPWLSQIAGRFESYLFQRLNFIYQPICPTTTSGSVMMAIDYDAEDDSPSSKTALMSFASAVRTNPWDAMVYNAAKSDLHKFGIQRFIRGSPLSTSSDYKTYDVGTLFLATQSTPSTAETTLGELYVEYTVRLFTPQITGSPTASVTREQTEIMTLTLPSGATGASLVSNIYGEGNSPIAWLDTIQNGSLTGTVRMLLDTTKLGPYLLNFVTQGTLINRGVALYMASNARAGGFPSDGYPISMIWNKVEDGALLPSVGTQLNTGTLTIKPAENRSYNASPAILPLYWARPTSGTTTYTIRLMPLGMIPPVVNGVNLETPTISTNVAWDYRQVAVPALSGQVVSPVRLATSRSQYDGEGVSNVFIKHFDKS